MTAILFALVALFGWGLGDLAVAQSGRKTGPFNTNFWLCLLPLLLSVPYFLANTDEMSRFTPGMLALTVGLGVIVNVAFLFFVRAFALGNPTIVGTIAGSFVALVVVLSMIFLDATLTAPQAWLVGLVILAIALTSLNLREWRSARKLDRSVLYALLAMAGWGVYFTFIKLPIDQVGWFLPNAVQLLVGLVMMTGLHFFKPIIKNPFKVGAAKPIALAVILTGPAVYAFNYALEIGNPAIVAPVAGAYPALFAVASWRFFREPITRLQVAGIMLTLAGIIGLSVVGS